MSHIEKIVLLDDVLWRAYKDRTARNVVCTTLNDVMSSHHRNFRLRERKSQQTPHPVLFSKSKPDKFKSKNFKRKLRSSSNDFKSPRENDSVLHVNDLPSSSFSLTVEDDLESLTDHIILKKLHFSPKDEEEFNRLMLRSVPKESCESNWYKNSCSDVLFPVSADIEKCSCLYKELFPKSKNKSQNVSEILQKLSHFQQWEQILPIVKPETWTTVTMYQVCQVFYSILKDSMLQRFIYVVLLPYLRNHIAVHKAIDIPLYKVLKISLSKPVLIFKSIIIPLCEAGNCTLREATILGVFLQTSDIPLLFIGSALIVIAGLPYTGACSIFIRALTEKKLSFPHRVVDALFDHFMKFIDTKKQYPLFWHKSLLAFVQNCKYLLLEDQRSSLAKLIISQHNQDVSPLVQKELTDYSIPAYLVPDF